MAASRRRLPVPDRLDPGILAGLREHKAPDELEPLRAAGREADTAMAWVAGLDLAGRSERGLALELQARFLSSGAGPYPDYLRPGNPAPLEAGHVFSVEPGIYVPGRFGVRYENLVHLGPDGPELLNAAPA